MAAKKRAGAKKSKTSGEPISQEPRRTKKKALKPDSASLLEDAVREIKKITGTGEKTALSQAGASRIIYIHGIGNKLFPRCSNASGIRRCSALILVNEADCRIG